MAKGNSKVGGGNILKPLQDRVSTASDKELQDVVNTINRKSLEKRTDEEKMVRAVAMDEMEKRLKDFIEETAQDMNLPENGLTNSDMQGVVEAYVATHRGLDYTDDDVIEMVRTRADEIWRKKRKR